MSRVAHDAITNEFLSNDVVRLENIDHGNYKFFNQTTIDNIVSLTADNSKAIKNQTGAYTNIAYQIKMNIAYNLHDMMQLAFYGWSVDKVTSHTVTLTSYKAVKLQALSKQIANIKVNNVTVNRIDIDDNSILSKFNGLNKDIIKECQRLDRGFIARVVTDRQDNITKHTFAK